MLPGKRIMLTCLNSTTKPFNAENPYNQDLNRTLQLNREHEAKKNERENVRKFLIGIRNLLMELKEKGYNQRFSKETYLKIYREYKNYEKISKELNKEFYHDIAFSHIFTNCLDLFHDLDDTVVDIILNNLRNEGTGANMILLNIGSFGKINIIKVLNKFSETNKFSVDKNLYKKLFYPGDVKSQSEFKETIIKNLVEAGYLNDLIKSYDLENGGPLQKIGISIEKFEEIVKRSITIMIRSIKNGG